MKRTNKKFIGLTFIIIIVAAVFIVSTLISKSKKQTSTVPITKRYWLILHRASNVEYLYFGEPGNKETSEIIDTFQIKSGIPGKRPTPLPSLVGREYWLITNKIDSTGNSETAPYFLTLDIPYSDSWPFGPEPYDECGGQCDWVLPGSFGLHGINGDEAKIASENKGSSGCIRHSDVDITFLYTVLNPEAEPIRYYIEDI